MGKIFSAVLTGSPNLPEPNDYEAHFLHCVDYMRQAAMCAGDLAIEPRGENGKPAQVNLVNAFNGLHGKSKRPVVLMRGEEGGGGVRMKTAQCGSESRSEQR